MLNKTIQIEMSKEQYEDLMQYITALRKQYNISFIIDKAPEDKYETEKNT